MQLHPNLSWNATGHAILLFTIGMDTLNLIEDYGKLMSDQVETTCIAHNAHGADLQACQNAQMMYKCLINSITDEAKSALPASELNFHEDGPTLFFHIVNQLFTAIFECRSNP